MDLYLHTFGRDLIAYQHTTGENPTVTSEVSRYRSDGNNIPLKGPSDVVDAYSTDEITLLQTPLRIEGSMRYYGGQEKRILT